MNRSRLARVMSACAACMALFAAGPAHAQQAADAGRGAGDRIFTPVTATRGMVASDHALATHAGVEVLRRGGNAVDAAVAVGFALAVTRPDAAGLGGGGFMMIHDAASGREVALDFRESAPAGPARDAAARGSDASAPPPVPGVGVPGMVAGLLHAHSAFGRLALAEVMAPAIELAEKGFQVTPTLAQKLRARREALARWPQARAIFFKDVEQPLPCSQPPCAVTVASEPLAAGDLLVQRDLARSLQAIARDGAAAFYQGEIGRLVAAEAGRHGSPLAPEDLRAYRAVERDPVSASYRGMRVIAMPPPSSGGVYVVQMLNLLQRYPLADYGAGSAQALHLMAETMKLAHAERARWLGESDPTRIPAAVLAAPAYADELARQIDPQRATPADRIAPGAAAPDDRAQATHYSVADAVGNAVSATLTLGSEFGTGRVAAGTGILLNDALHGATDGTRPAGGRVGTVEPGARPSSAMSPVIVYRDGLAWLVTGSNGATRIISTVLQAIIDAVDFGMHPAESAAMPRIHHPWKPDFLRVEKGLSPDTTTLLSQMGHDVRVMPVMGGTQTIQIEDGRLSGASDPRNPDGLTAGY